MSSARLLPSLTTLILCGITAILGAQETSVVSVGVHRVEVMQVGVGSPTIVLESGLMRMPSLTRLSTKLTGQYCGSLPANFYAAQNGITYR
jgi:hypothetical protein